MRRIAYDDEIDMHLTEIIKHFQQIGIKGVTKPDALRYLIRVNKDVLMRSRRKPRSRYGIVF